ncbi:hypothetical protein P4H27_29500 [Paenibacillus taichungensis]|uniref:hypothetical protein n=1 Tax=Paenibacillus TaxID=44249 RepID=UPI00096F81B3|nr:hypothetical protein [Paenibacillus taichungensis]MEC0111092.1 hypothetical protein [Paenibacillus taichungensis]MEC0196893.1 hypothetical protein [Paenibacillus taichungensis]OME83702.1 hypothetical protein BK122_09810 [Paenibacillus pabuli]
MSIKDGNVEEVNDEVSVTAESVDFLSDLEFFNVRLFGAIGDGNSHPLSSIYTSLEEAQTKYPKAKSLNDEIDVCAIQAAFDAASEQTIGPNNGGTVFFPSGRYLCNVPLYGLDISVDGDPQAATLVFPEFWEGNPAITVDRSSGKRQVWRNISVVGPGTYDRNVRGVRTAWGSGIKVVNSAMPLFENLQIRHFGWGMDWANSAGHIKLFHTNIEYCWYGVYVSHNSGDYWVEMSTVNQNAFANFATHASSGIEALSMRSSHCGYSPFSFYCEPEPNKPGGSNIFLKDLVLDHVRFEQVGNAAIYSDPSMGANPRVEGIRILDMGFSWDADKGKWLELPDWPRDYAIDIGMALDGPIMLHNDSYPFTKGKVNMMRIREQQASAPVTIIGHGNTTDHIEVVSGIKRVTVGSDFVLQQGGSYAPQQHLLSRSDRANNRYELNITQDGTTGAGFQLAHLKNGTRTELMYATDGNTLRFRRPILLDELINPGRSSTALLNPREGAFYVDTSNASYECVRTYIGGRWNRQGAGSAMPTVGSWQRSDYITNTAPTIIAGVVTKGWFRLTSGTGNVLGTDWLEDKITI